ncbi:MAG TPA: hypothetical protein PLP34_09540 [Chitinophagaceae bacterium]|nr:hypothetical protein [Chitinophagaceae bacterium]
MKYSVLTGLMILILCQHAQSQNCVFPEKTITYKNNQTKTGIKEYAVLNEVAFLLKQNPSCIMVFYSSAPGNKVEMKRDWECIDGAMRYLIDKKNMDPESLRWGGHAEHLTSGQILVKGDDGLSDHFPTTVPPPFPDRR